MRFKQTPAVEASLVYGISLVLSFLALLIVGAPDKALLFAEYIAALLLMPTWVLIVIVGLVTKRVEKIRRVSYQAMVIVAVTAAVGAFINYARADFATNAKVGAKQLETFVATFTMLDVTYFFTAMAALAFTHFFIFRKQQEVAVRGNEYGVPPRTATPRVKPTRPAPPAKPKRNK